MFKTNQSRLLVENIVYLFSSCSSLSILMNTFNKELITLLLLRTLVLLEAEITGVSLSWILDLVNSVQTIDDRALIMPCLALSQTVFWRKYQLLFFCDYFYCVSGTIVYVSKFNQIYDRGSHDPLVA